MMSASHRRRDNQPRLSLLALSLLAEERNRIFFRPSMLSESFGHWQENECCAQ